MLSEGNYSVASIIITDTDLCGQRSERTQLILTNTTTIIDHLDTVSNVATSESESDINNRVKLQLLIIGIPLGII